MQTTRPKRSQLLLFDIPPETGNRRNSKDATFTENRGEPIHRWVPWIAGFSAMFVRDMLDRYATTRKRKNPIRVVDPFCGVGTTLLEAMKRGYSAAGFEINPYAALAARTKLESLRVDAGSFRKAVSRFEESMVRASRARLDPWGGHVSKAPTGFRTRTSFFSRQVEQKVLTVLDFIHTLRSPIIRDLFRVAFAAVMVKFSNYSYEPSLTRRVSSGKSPVLEAPVFEIVSAKLREMEADITDVQSRIGRPNGWPSWAVYEDTCLASKLHMNARSADLVITSPPYLNNYHYVRNARPQSYWLGLVQSPKDLVHLERQNFGMFWQTVRELPPIPLVFDYPELQRLLDEVRKRNPDKGVYGGAGWANYAASYFNDCSRFAGQLKRILRPGGRAVVVIGNSILQGVEVKTDSFFAGICGQFGLKLEDIELVRKKRTGSSIINSTVRAGGAGERVRLYEVAVVLRRLP